MVCAKTVFKAVAFVNGTINGTIFFEQHGEDAPVKVFGDIDGLSAGKHGFHVHQYGDLSGGCLSAGPHFNPFNKTHGAPDDETRHVGDLGNIIANDKGRATLDIKDELIQLTGDLNIVGRAIVIHQGVDDLGKGGNEESTKTGNAGARLGCAIIGIAK
ncbi:hypothetical protein VHEMI10404 [[Torrubiella] hemipterigena]|uniref:Superoxide dismutase [Cu-Zn] n=1 Tax=[Torrubiella] hemipterigena TaxID=1531966 RepID=A0A0A1TT77_9HYPO|nr:hypothetical protein VHEMI10404 [[Torrubiella] hemipterigena]